MRSNKINNGLNKNNNALKVQFNDEAFNALLNARKVVNAKKIAEFLRLVLRLAIYLSDLKGYSA